MIIILCKITTKDEVTISWILYRANLGVLVLRASWKLLGKTSSLGKTWVIKPLWYLKLIFFLRLLRSYIFTGLPLLVIFAVTGGAMMEQKTSTHVQWIAVPTTTLTNVKSSTIPALMNAVVNHYVAGRLR